MVFCIDFFRKYNPLNCAGFVNNECGAEHTHILPAVHGFFAPSAKLFR